jgi:hypothetical protein
MGIVMNGLSQFHQTLLNALSPTARRITEFIALACTSSAKEKLEGILKANSIAVLKRNHFTIEFLSLLSLLPSSAGWRAIGSDVRLGKTAREIVGDQCKGVLAFFGALDEIRSANKQLLRDSDC